MKPLNIGIVGLGLRMAHVMSLFSSAGGQFKLVAYADPSPSEDALSALRTKGLLPENSYTELADMLAAEPLDLLMVGSPNFLHLEHTRLGLEAGLRVFAEKPVVMDEQQTWQMLELVKKYGDQSILVGLVLRYSHHMRDMQDLLSDGAIGQPVLIQACEHLEPEHGAFFMRDWRRYSKYSGGFMLEKCCHDLDLYNMILNSRPMQVASAGGRKIFVPENEPPTYATDAVYQRKKGGWSSETKVFDSDADIVDYQNALVSYENGTSLVFSTSLSAPDEQRRFTVIGTKGMVEGDFVNGFLKAHDARTGDCILHKEYGETNGASEAGHYGADRLMVDDIKKHLIDAAPLPVSIVDALQAGMLAMKIDEARTQQQLIDMQSVWEQFDGIHASRDLLSEANR